MTHANFVEIITVTDPETQGDVELEVYKDSASGAMFAIDSSYLEQVSDEIPSPFNKSQMIKLHYVTKLS